MLGNKQRAKVKYQFSFSGVGVAMALYIQINLVTGLAGFFGTITLLG